MPTITEKYDSRELGDNSAARFYILDDYATDVDALTALASTAPTTLNDLPRTGLVVREIGGGVHEGEASYGSQSSSSEAGTVDFQFEISTTNTHITHSKETLFRANADGPTDGPDMQGSIGVSADGTEVAGCDIITPTFSFTKTLVKAADDVDSTYIQGVKACVGRVNDGSFFGFSAGEVLCAGVSGSRNGQNFDLTFRFLESDNATGLLFGDIEVDKGGWEYLWILYEDDVDDTAKSLIKIPKAVYVERVYDEADFSALGVGS